jgi:DUF4097 and DUF4098 domain-containing protein YvlB
MFSSALLLVLVAAAPSTWKGETQGSPEVSISNVEGSIRVQGVEGKTVSVEARGEGDQDVSDLFRVEQDGDEVEIQACCGSCAKGLRNSCKNPPTVHFVVKVPRESRLEVSSVTAPVTVSGVTGAQELTVVSGDVSTSGSRGKLEVTSVSGNVDLAPDALASTEITTVGGNVKLKLPRGAGAEVDFSSVGGRFNGRSVELGSSHQRYGTGEHKVEVSTVGGTFDVRSDESSK